MKEGDRAWTTIRDAEEMLEAFGRRPSLICWGMRDFLIQQGYLSRTARGRVATRRAYEHFGLKAPRPADDRRRDQAGGLVDCQAMNFQPLGVFVQTSR